MALTKATYSMIEGAVANVLDFGAYNDGTNAATTTAAIQAALDSGASTVFLPAGEYLVNDTIYLPSNTTLMGDGANVNMYTKATSGTVIVAAPGSFGGTGDAVLRAGDALELTCINIKSLVVDIRDANADAIGIRKETCNHFQMYDIWVMASFDASNQVAYFNGNGTHCYFENINLYGGKTSCYMDNTSNRECHDSVFNKIWMYPKEQANAVCLYFNGDGVSGGNAISTWIMPYMETGSSGLVTGVLNENYAGPQLTMIYPSWDGSFLWLWNAAYPPRTRFIGGNLSTFDPSLFNGAFGRCTIVGREGNQFVEKLYLNDIGGDVQFGVDSSGFNFGRISAGAAKILRIQGGKKTEVIGTVNSGSVYTETISMLNADIGDPVVIGMDWNGTGAYTLTAQVVSGGTVRYWLQNISGAPVDYGTRVLKVVGYNGSIT